jgi:hypothetical protein
MASSIELADLRVPDHPRPAGSSEGSPDRQNALITLRNIRWVLLMRRDPAP